MTSDQLRAQISEILRPTLKAAAAAKGEDDEERVEDQLDDTVDAVLVSIATFVKARFQ